MSVVAVVGGKNGDKRRKALKMLGNFVYIHMWINKNVFHGYPQTEIYRQFSTAFVYNQMFIMWITSWKMWIVPDISGHAVRPVIFSR